MQIKNKEKSDKREMIKKERNSTLTNHYVGLF